MGKFFGTYERTLDAKNRLLLPSKLMGEMPSRLYMLKGFEGAIALYTEESFSAFMAKLEGVSYFDSKARNFIRLAAGSVIPLDVDSHSRINIPTDIKKRYGINEEVVVLGALDHLEIFDRAKYESYLKSQSGTYEEIADSLAHLEDNL